MVNNYLKSIYINPLEQHLDAALANAGGQFWGHATAVQGESVHISGLSNIAHLGDQICLNPRRGAEADGEIIALKEGEVVALLYDDPTQISVGTILFHAPARPLYPSAHWIGTVLNHAGQQPDHTFPSEGHTPAPLKRHPPTPATRKPLGKRLNTSYCAFDTFLPLCKGQRLGLFAGSGVGKSTLIAGLAKGVEADIVIVALIGERGREVRHFVDQTLGPEGMKRAIVIAATSNDPAPLKKRAAYTAMALAEFFRDQGLHVLLLFDSLTRFAEAHREVALSAGEIPSLHAFPPSTFRAVASLAERAGPGSQAKKNDNNGDITAIFSVLVAGSDMDEPVADMVRGILDGHVVLERTIAERGRYPAIDIRRSVSRSLPDAASNTENLLLTRARELFANYEEAAPLIRAGLYMAGSDKTIDEAIHMWPRLDKFIGKTMTQNCQKSFSSLQNILDKDPLNDGSEEPTLDIDKDNPASTPKIG